MKNCVTIFLTVLVLCFFYHQSVSAFEGDVFNISSNTFIKNWLVAGPFPNPPNTEPEESLSWTRGFDHDFLVSIGGESNAVLTDGQEIEYTDFDKEIRSIEVISASANDQGILVFDDLFPGQDYKLAYVYTEIISDIDQECAFLLGSDDGVKVWLNGKLIHKNDVGRGLTPGEDFFTGQLNKGANRLLVKVTDYIANWALIVEAFDSEGYERHLQALKGKGRDRRWYRLEQ